MLYLFEIHSSIFTQHFLLVRVKVDLEPNLSKPGTKPEYSLDRIWRGVKVEKWKEMEIFEDVSNGTTWKAN